MSKQELTTIYLDPKKWLRGCSTESRLWDPRKNRGCCVGLGLLQLGVKEDDIASYFTVAGARDSIGEIPAPFQWMSAWGGSDDDSVYEANDDDSTISDAERVKRINAIAEPHGLRFVLQETP